VQDKNARAYAHARRETGKGIKYLGFAPLNARIHGEMVVVCRFRVWGYEGKWGCRTRMRGPMLMRVGDLEKVSNTLDSRP